MFRRVATKYFYSTVSVATSRVRRRSSSSSSSSSWSGDTLVALGIPLGCAALLVEAYFRTNLRDAQAPHECAFAASTQMIQPHHVQTLQETGIVVIPQVLLPSVLAHAQEQVQQLRQSSFLEASDNDATVRQDQIAWVTADKQASQGSAITEQTTTTSGSSLSHCIQLVRGVANALEQHGYRHHPGHHPKHASSTLQSYYHVPLQCQLAMYQGNGKALYHRHLDQCNASLTELGLLEWLRASDYRHRALTVILYLNDPDRTERDGGALRCWLPVEANQEENATNITTTNHNNEMQQPDQPTTTTTTTTQVDILPTGGTLVIFQSDRVEHMVLPSTQDRFALTLWINDSLAD